MAETDVIIPPIDSAALDPTPTRVAGGIELITLGCRLNTYESEVMRGQAAAAGLGDTVIINTCAVTAEAVSQFARERLGEGNRAALIYTPRRGDEATALVSSAAEGLV